MKDSSDKFKLFSLVRNNYNPWLLRGYVYEQATLTDNDVFCHHCTELDSPISFPVFPNTFLDYARCLRGDVTFEDYDATKADQGEHTLPEDWLTRHGWNPEFRPVLCVPTDHFDQAQLFTHPHPKYRGHTAFLFEAGAEQLAIITSAHFLSGAMEKVYGE